MTSRHAIKPEQAEETSEQKTKYGKRLMIVTLDGPAGAGKSTIARQLAERLGFEFLDTGAMYRAVTLAALRNEGPWDDQAGLAELVRRCRIDMDGTHVRLNGDDVSELIRMNEVTSHIHHLADNPAVRQHLVELQRAIAVGKDLVTEGRDQGTVAFPNAECKIFLTASPEERAQRRLQELQARGKRISLEEVLKQQNERDYRDSNRKIGRLEPARDAVHVSTDGMSPDGVVERIVQIVREKARQADA